MNAQPLTPAAEMAAHNQRKFPNESTAYRQARNALLAEEIELRRHIEKVAEMRRALPIGGEVPHNYEFMTEEGFATLSQLFGDKQTLAIYSYMYGPQRERPCPMCTCLISALDGQSRDIEQNIAFAIVARSPMERLIQVKRERGWRHIKLISDLAGDFTRDYVSAEDEDIAAFNVFTRRDGKIRHFWSEEMSGEMADPGQDPRGAANLMPLWTLLDTTPAGRDPHWYPKLDY